MSDRRIDELPVKSAAQLALTDFLIGHGDDEPAAFRSELDEVLDFLGPTLVSRFSDDIVDEVVESGSNANGEYVRFANGTQICWAAVYRPSGDAIVTANSDGGGFRSDTVTAPLPAAFISDVRTFVTSAGNTRSFWARSGSPSSSTFQWILYNHESYANDWQYYMLVLAIGRWK